MADDNNDDQPQERRKWSKPCPKCGSHYLRSGPWPWYLGTVGAMFCKAVVCTDCGHDFDFYKPQADFAKRKMWMAIILNGIGGIGILGIVALLLVWIFVIAK